MDEKPVMIEVGDTIRRIGFSKQVTDYVVHRVTPTRALIRLGPRAELAFRREVRDSKWLEKIPRPTGYIYDHYEHHPAKKET